MADAIGGWRGALESAIPTVVFVLMVTIDRHEVRRAAVIAVIAAVVLAVVRLTRGQTIRYVAGGLAGVALAAFVAERTGRAENFFLPGLLLNAGWAAVFAISVLARRPLVGYLAAGLTGREVFGSWRHEPAARIPAARATWVFVALFVSRLAVQIPLYLGGALVALGTAKVAMGVPLTAVGVWIAWLLMRQSPLVTGPRPTRTP